jgi:hypothetical protein
VNNNFLSKEGPVTKLLAKYILLLNELSNARYKARMLDISHFRRYLPGERNIGIHWIVGWVGPTACLNAVEKGRIPFLPLVENEPR